MAKKPSLGRQKIKIAKIEKPNHRQVTFSKRRSGLFKKACELSTLCGVEIGIVVFSPASKVFSFGHPNVESIVDKFFNIAPTNTANSTAVAANASVHALNAQLTRVNGLLEAEKERKASLERVAEWWWEAPVGEMGRAELDQMSASLEELKRNVALLRGERVIDETTSSDDYYQMAGPATGYRGFVGHDDDGFEDLKGIL